jgi:hypothetical protein
VVGVLHHIHGMEAGGGDVAQGIGAGLVTGARGDVGREGTGELHVQRAELLCVRLRCHFHILSVQQCACACVQLVYVL